MAGEEARLAAIMDGAKALLAGAFMEELHEDIIGRAKRILTEETILSMKATRLLPELIAAVEQAWSEIRGLRATLAAQESDNEILRRELRAREGGEDNG